MDRYDELWDAVDGMGPEMAKDFLTELGESGDAAAQCLLADSLDDGTFGYRDPGLSIAWYRRSAAQGFDRAEYFLGSMTAHGIGTVRDFETAAFWFRRGAEKGDPQALFRLAELLIKHLVEALPNEDGLKLLALAASNGSDSAKALLKDLDGKR